MHNNKTVLALFKDADDEALSSPLLAGVPGIVRMVAGDNAVASIENVKRLGIEPCLAIISARLYPADRPDLVRELRKRFPRSEILVVSSAADTFPPLQLLAADMVRHLAINPAAPENEETMGDFDSAIRKLVAGHRWGMADQLRCGAVIHERVVSSSAEKEELIGMIERTIEGDSSEHELLRQRGALLADEMLENAMYGAPKREDGSKVYRKGEERVIAPHERIVFRFGFDGELLAMEVTDGWGSLSPDLVLRHLADNQSGEGSPDETGGRGLFIIWRIMDHFHISITPGVETVVGGHLRASSSIDLETPRGYHISTHI